MPTSVRSIERFLQGWEAEGFQLKLHVKDNVTPVAHPVRILPFGLRAKVDEKLDELLAKDIIKEVSHNPTEWVLPLVVIPKTDGDVRICVDMRKANSAIERERHPIPTIEEVLYNLNGSTVFSKLDLKWGFCTMSQKYIHDAIFLPKGRFTRGR